MLDHQHPHRVRRREVYQQLDRTVHPDRVLVGVGSTACHQTLEYHTSRQNPPATPPKRPLKLEIASCVGAVASPPLANVYLHYVFDQWAHQWRGRHAHGDMVIVRFADEYIVGFEQESDARQFLSDLRGRLAKFALELAPEKTRLIEFGRHAAARRAARGLGRPETFQFLGFTHISAKTRNGRFKLVRITIAKRMAAKLRQIKTELARRRHLPIPE